MRKNINHDMYVNIYSVKLADMDKNIHIQLLQRICCKTVSKARKTMFKCS